MAVYLNDHPCILDGRVFNMTTQMENDEYPNVCNQNDQKYNNKLKSTKCLNQCEGQVKIQGGGGGVTLANGTSIANSILL